MRTKELMFLFHETPTWDHDDFSEFRTGLTQRGQGVFDVVFANGEFQEYQSKWYHGLSQLLNMSLPPCQLALSNCGDTNTFYKLWTELYTAFQPAHIYLDYAPASRLFNIKAPSNMNGLPNFIRALAAARLDASDGATPETRISDSQAHQFLMQTLGKEPAPPECRNLIGLVPLQPELRTYSGLMKQLQRLTATHYVGTHDNLERGALNVDNTSNATHGQHRRGNKRGKDFENDGQSRGRGNGGQYKGRKFSKKFRNQSSRNGQHGNRNQNQNQQQQ